MSSLGYFAVGLGLLAVYLVAMAAVLFGAVGTLAVPMFWAYLTLFAVLCVGASAAIYLQSPDLVKERVRPGDIGKHPLLIEQQRGRRQRGQLVNDGHAGVILPFWALEDEIRDEIRSV